MRFLICLFAFLALIATPALAQNAYRQGVEAQFHQWLERTAWPDAQRQGITRATFQRLTSGLALNWDLPDLAPPGAPKRPPERQHQAEFSSPGRYFSEKQLANLTAIGRRLAKEHGRALNAIERQYGVPRGILLAIWGRESAFGRAKIPHDGLRVLATKAFMSTRTAMFYPEFIAALRILQEGHAPSGVLYSSWAGALGQPQFLPTKFLAYAVDFDGDGHRNIWTSAPDTLASIANYLRQHGWQPGRAWGAEVRLPQALSCTLEGPEQGRPLEVWGQAGISGSIERLGRGSAFLMMPAGRHGPAFLVSDNFYVLKRYNESDLYALFIGHLGDRIEGRGQPFSTSWKAPDGFSRGDVRAMQQRLVKQGHDVGGADGLAGFKTRIAIGRWQEAQGRAATCFPDRELTRAIH
ncbi:membrane protein [Agaricicola taiwanensis]|uniref:Membrane protein n=1 Tax=Agaricicola taiwanensis TaxID=591372 RepID=A0A8J2VST7_9RHOB|nr:lytic murein transglycosylase [Agaricicola taiwanensis]GGE40454.1 membrane protein [Agaricicola taiwanensis]